MKNSIKIAFCGVLAALSTVILFLTGVVPTATVALPALAGCMLIPAVVELGKRWALGVYAVCGVLSFLLVPDREAALLYVLFFGYYPVLLPALNRLNSRALRWAIKLLAFNAAAVLETLLAIYVLGIPWENLGPLGQATPVVLLLLANLVFLAYDYVLKGLAALYLQRLHGRIKKFFRQK